MEAQKQKKNIVKKARLYICLLVVAFWWLPFSLAKKHHLANQKKGKVVAELLSHVGDSYQLHFGEVVFSLPVIVYKKGDGWYVFSSKHLYNADHQPTSYKGFRVQEGKITAENSKVYDFSITQNVVGMLWSSFLMLLIFIGLAIYMRRKKARYPQGFWVLPFSMIRFIRNEVASQYIEKKHITRLTPFLLTLFFYILFNNLLGLLPGSANLTGNFSITLTLASLAFFATHWYASKAYWKHLFRPPEVPILLYPIMIPIEIVSVLIKFAILPVRLCANMLSGHIMIVFVIGSIFMLENRFIPFMVVPFGTGIVLLKIFVSFIQAYVFTLLVAIFLGKATSKHTH